MNAPQKFRKKPVTIEAMQWDGTAAGASPIIDWVLSNGGTATYACTSDPCSRGEDGHTIAVDTLEGRNLDARSGWWVICGVEGEFYPCKPSVFAVTYEEAE